MKYSLREQKLQRIIETEKLINEIQDVDVLLERLLTEARAIVRADAGSIYIVEDKYLKIKYAQNDTQQRDLAPGDKMPYVSFSFPITDKSISGYCANHGEIINIKDAYKIPEGTPYAFNKSTDVTTGYRTKAMLTLPLTTAEGHTLGVLQIINAQDEQGNVIDFDEDAELYIMHFASNATQALEKASLLSNQFEHMQKMAEYRDPRETTGHMRRVSDFSLEIYDRWAANHHIPNQEQQKYRDTLKMASKCHDFGKVGVSDLLLKKEKPRFTDEERAVMKGHTCIGALLFTPTESALDAMARDINFRHHEWWDGSDAGYPGEFDYTQYVIGNPVPKCRPLKGIEIPLAARIVALADVFDALSHRRVYKEAWSMEDSLMEIENMSGKQFDPEVVMAFMQVKDRILAINAAYESESN